MNSKNILVYPKYPSNLHHLYQLAQNLWCTWNYDAINLFYRIDARLFKEVSHNPIKFLHSLSKERLESLSADRGFLFELEKVWQQFEEYMRFDADAKSRRLSAISIKSSLSFIFQWSSVFTNRSRFMRAALAYLPEIF